MYRSIIESNRMPPRPGGLPSPRRRGSHKTTVPHPPTLLRRLPRRACVSRALSLWSGGARRVRARGEAAALAPAAKRQGRGRGDERCTDSRVVPRIMQCKAMQRNAMQCNATQRNATQCNAIQCNATQCNAMQCNATQRNAMQCNATQCNAMQRNATQYNVT